MIEVSKMTRGMTEAEVLALPAAVDLATAGRALGIGRTKAFELARTGQFPVKVLHVGQKSACRARRSWKPSASTRAQRPAAMTADTPRSL